jgi:hypothetical protein
MAKCKVCKEEIGTFRSLLQDTCFECNRKKERKEEEEQNKKEKALKMLRTRGITVLKDDTLTISIEQTSLRNQIPKKYQNFPGNLTIQGISISKETGKEIPIAERLIEIVIVNKFDKEEVDELVEDFLEKQLIKIETEKINERQKRHKIREKAEKQVFGKSKKKKRISLSEDKKEAIFEKYNNQCAICDNTEGLHLHHKDNNPSNNKINNLIVLCGVCHKKIHMRVR